MSGPDARNLPGSPGAAGGPVYRDIRGYLAELERRNLLIRVRRRVNKDTEVMPLVRWQFRGLAQSQRKGWLFENLTDARGRSFDGSVAVGIAGASPEAYAAAIGVQSPGDIQRRWLDALAHPVQPVQVAAAQAPVKQVVIAGSELAARCGSPVIRRPACTTPAPTG
jgi:3-polyprenyl-4-hydroxybenzoate decarboxylase